MHDNTSPLPPLPAEQLLDTAIRSVYDMLQKSGGFDLSDLRHSSLWRMLVAMHALGYTSLSDIPNWPETIGPAMEKVLLNGRVPLTAVPSNASPPRDYTEAFNAMGFGEDVLVFVERALYTNFILMAASQLVSIKNDPPRLEVIPAAWGRFTRDLTNAGETFSVLGWTPDVAEVFAPLAKQLFWGNAPSMVAASLFADDGIDLMLTAMEQGWVAWDSDSLLGVENQLRLLHVHKAASHKQRLYALLNKLAA